MKTTSRVFLDAEEVAGDRGGGGRRRLRSDVAAEGFWRPVGRTLCAINAEWRRRTSRFLGGSPQFAVSDGLLTIP